MKKIITIFFLFMLFNIYPQATIYKYNEYETDRGKTFITDTYLYILPSQENAYFEVDKDKRIENKLKSSKRNLWYTKNKSFVTYFELFVSNRAYRIYKIEDSIPTMQWKLHNETQTIGNMLCYKATTNFRGREWTIWYNPKIPVSQGPWKFYNLPGLLVKATEDEGIFAYTLAEIKTNQPFEMPDLSHLDNAPTLTMKKYYNMVLESEHSYGNTLGNDFESFAFYTKREPVYEGYTKEEIELWKLYKDSGGKEGKYIQIKD